MDVLREFVAEAAKVAPGFEVRFKDKSLLMKTLGVVLSPFNPYFMTEFITTLGSTVYFPSQAMYEQDPDGSLRVLMHELVHAWDRKKHSLFGLTYLFPQILALPLLLLFGVLAWPYSWILAIPLVGYGLAAILVRVHKALSWVALVVAVLAALSLALALTGWSCVALFLALVSLAPWPAPWRVRWELRGYTMSVVSTYWMTGCYSRDYRAHIVQQFVGPTYYYMSWDQGTIERALDAAYHRAQTLGVIHEEPFEMSYAFLQQHHLMWHVQ